MPFGLLGRLPHRYQLIIRKDVLPTLLGVRHLKGAGRVRLHESVALAPAEERARGSEGVVRLGRRINQLVEDEGDLVGGNVQAPEMPKCTFRSRSVW